MTCFRGHRTTWRRESNCGEEPSHFAGGPSSQKDGVRRPRAGEGEGRVLLRLEEEGEPLPSAPLRDSGASVVVVRLDSGCQERVLCRKL